MKKLGLKTAARLAGICCYAALYGCHALTASAQGVATGKSALKTASPTLNVPVPPIVLSNIRAIHIGSTRGFLEKTLLHSSAVGGHWLPPYDFIYLIPPPADFQKKHPGYWIGLRVTFGHDYLPSTLLNGPGMSKKDKHYNEGYNAAVVTAIAQPYVTLRTEANSGPNVLY